MVQFQKGDLALAHFKGYPLWPIRIVSITSQKVSKKTAKGVNHAFRECESSFDIYRQFLKKKDAKGLGTDPTVIASTETSAIQNQLILAQDEVLKLKAGLVKDIEKKSSSKSGDRRKLRRLSATSRYKL
jgi:hypothetical protein